MHVYLNLDFKNQFFHIIVSLSEGYNRVLEKFQKIVIFGQKFENLFFGSNCSSFILHLNAENRINIRAVYNEIHVSNFFSVWDLYGSDP